MKMRQLLDKKGHEVHSIAPEATIHHAIKMMAAARIGSLLVKDAAGLIVGIVTERDCLQATAIDPATLDGRRTAEIMTRDLIVAGPDDDLTRVARLMRDHHCRHVPIMEQGRVSGMVSMRDILRERFEETRTELEHLRSYIAGQS